MKNRVIRYNGNRIEGVNIKLELVNTLVSNTTLRFGGVFNDSKLNNRAMYTIMLNNDDDRKGRIWNSSSYFIHVYGDNTFSIDLHFYLSIDAREVYGS